MPLYRFILHAFDVIDDPDGGTFPDDAGALAEAVKIIRELRRHNRSDQLDWAIAVTEGDRQVAWVPFDTVE
jgi:hypothetical protein